jgi:hypothetical protein
MTMKYPWWTKQSCPQDTHVWELLHCIGSRPPPDADGTSEQIIGLAHELEAFVTYCDFAKWGPHRHSSERKLRLTGPAVTATAAFAQWSPWDLPLRTSGWIATRLR